MWRDELTSATSTANTYRTVLLLVMCIAHAIAIWQLRYTIRWWNSARRLDIYLAVACMETALLNGYLWMFAFTAHGEFVFVPFYAITGQLFVSMYADGDRCRAFDGTSRRSVHVAMTMRVDKCGAIRLLSFPIWTI